MSKRRTLFDSFLGSSHRRRHFYALSARIEAFGLLLGRDEKFLLESSGQSDTLHNATQEKTVTLYF